MKKLSKFLISTIGCELVGIAATPFTLSAIQTWYQTLNKPSFSPPNWVFGPAWTILYFLMGVAAYLVWIKGLEKKAVKNALAFFIAQLVFNFLWSILFFGLHSPILGLIDILILWTLILITIIKFYKISKTAAYLLIPYLLWVTFATILNLSIVLLNP
ncbi:tryptophan-rich sensory protein [Candidatus Daviesbacteria bacterium]|nr:tryptophan-rich sensory protein [Candidatus Daviesbacteria bacterium]